MKRKENIVSGELTDKRYLRYLLGLGENTQKLLFEKAARVKEASVGNKVYFRGLIEFSNLCAKDCYYCGIRKSNKNFYRYNLRDEEILHAAEIAYEQNYASIVLQAGEIASRQFTRRIDKLLGKIHRKTFGALRITLSLGEQSYDTYRQWFESGASRYLLRIETTNQSLYRKIHPANNSHSFIGRMHALESLKHIGYQTGTGVMIGLPFQTTDDLANDLLFMRQFEIDMVGMGPYIEHADTPLFHFRENLWRPEERFYMALKMIACLRMLMPKINIAAATALQAIDKFGREKAIRAGANVVMPNITPGKYRDRYKLYDNKPCTDEDTDDCMNCMISRIGMTGNQVGLGEWGDSAYFRDKLICAQAESTNAQGKSSE